MRKKERVLVVGGGASGLAAAIATAQAGGVSVTVAERLDRAGKKLLATGNGRCNLTNSRASAACYHTAEPDRLAEILALAPPEQVLAFFENLGLLCSEEAQGRVYPHCRQASMVLDVLRAALGALGVRVECGCRVMRIEKKAGAFQLSAEDGRHFGAERVILAAGGQAAPQLGTDGAGFALARACGHTVRTPYPCLVPLRCASFPAGLRGVRAIGALTLFEGEEPLCCERGEVQFAEYGFSGIPAMQLSCLLTPGRRDVSAAMDFFPELPQSELCALLCARRREGAFAALETLLLGLIGKKAGYAVLKSCGLQPLSRQSASLTDAQCAALAAALKQWRFPVTGTLPWAQAQTTGGGVPLGEIDTATCASLVCPGLYLTGELLDAAGACGGFNLQWAFATGILAGRAAARNKAAP